MLAADPFISSDSITRQHHVALTYMVRQLNLTFILNPDWIEYTDVNHVHQFVLHPSAQATAFMEKAGVPPSRLKRPFLTLIQNHLSLSEADVRMVTHADPNYVWKHAQARVDDWDKIVKHLATPVPGEDDTVTEDTVVLFNSGAHVRVSDGIAALQVSFRFVSGPAAFCT